jgi:N-dimethylarginine dimethylaminohydrolase
MSILNCNVNNEWSTLKTVIVGSANSWGPNPTPEQAVDPKSREHLLAGTYPTESDVRSELSSLVSLLESEGVEVLRPNTVEDLNQVFSRDVGVVITDKLVRTSMIADRTPEWNGIAPLLSELQSRDILTPPLEVRVEGGDVMPMMGEIWVGYGDSEDFENYKTARTNEAALSWLAEEFPHHTIRGFALSKSDSDPRLNALHLDCCLSVLGGGHAIFHPEGLKNESDRQWIRDKFEDKILEVDSESMYHMHCNLFSITPETVISGEGFDTVNSQLKNWGYRVLTTPMNETSKMEGLLRCVTLPIIRS